MYFVVTETCKQVDDGPFPSRGAALEYVLEATSVGGRYAGCYLAILSHREMDEMELALAGEG